MTCADVSDRIIDFLYGELDEEARRAFEAHLATCDSCRLDVESYGVTLGHARAALAAGNEAPPAAVKQGSDKMAELVARRRGRPFRTLGAPVIAEDAGGFWGLLRKPWFFPVFAAASVIGLFFLAQEAIVRRAMPLAPSEAAAPQASPAAKSAPGESPTPAAGPTIEPIVPAQPPPAEAEPARDRESLGAAAAAPAASERRRSVPPASRARREVVDPFAPANQADEAPAVGKAAAAAPARAPSLEGTQDPWHAREISRPASGAYRKAAAPEAAPANNFANEVVEPFSADRARKAKRAEPAAAAASDDAVSGAGFAVPPPAPLPAAVPAAAPAASAPASPPAGASSAGLARAKRESPESEQRALIELGDRLLSEQRMVEAAAVYRSLIARYPKHPDVPLWKQRLEKASSAAP